MAPSRVLVRDEAGKGRSVQVECDIKSGEIVFGDTPLTTWTFLPGKLSPFAARIQSEFPQKIADLLLETMAHFTDLTNEMNAEVAEYALPPQSVCDSHPILQLYTQLVDKSLHLIVGNEDSKSVRAELMRFLLVCYNNAHHAVSKDITAPRVCGLFTLAAKLNHSCDPSTVINFVQNDDGTVRLEYRAIRDILAGDYVSASYLNEVDLLLPTMLRKYILYTTKFFDCLCERCSRNIINIDDLNPERIMAEPTKETEPVSVTAWRLIMKLNKIMSFDPTPTPHGHEYDREIVCLLESTLKQGDSVDVVASRALLLLHYLRSLQGQITTLLPQIIGPFRVLQKYIVGSYWYFKCLNTLLAQDSAELDGQVLYARFLITGVPITGLWPVTQWPDLSCDIKPTFGDSVYSDFAVFVVCLKQDKSFEFDLDEMYRMMGKLLRDAWSSIRRAHKYKLLLMSAEEILLYKSIKKIK